MNCLMLLRNIDLNFFNFIGDIYGDLCTDRTLSTPILCDSTNPKEVPIPQVVDSTVMSLRNLYFAFLLTSTVGLISLCPG
jgi:hypothetical protein